jgi:glycosyltransferase involved in cell wall biosynthesis
VPPVVAIVTEIPTPYRAPLYDRLASRGVIAPHVLYLVEREVSRTTLAVDCAGHRHEHLRGGGLSLRTRHGPFTWKWTRGLARRLDALAPDAVLVSGWAHPAMHVASRWAAARGVPTLVTSESHPRAHRSALRTWLRDRVARPLVTGASAWLPVSTRAQTLLERLGADRTRCFVVPNAPDVARFAAARADLEARAALRAELGAGDEPVTLFVGRLIPAKGLDVLLEAAARLRPTPLTWIAGGGPAAARLAGKARALGERVRFLGEQPYARVVRLCAAADVIVLASIHEPYGVALHEGMAAGCAALASDAVGAAGDLVEEGVSGHVVPSSDAPALAEAWADLVGDRERLAARGRAAAARAEAHGQLFAAMQVERAVAAARAAKGAIPFRAAPAAPSGTAP